MLVSYSTLAEEELTTAVLRPTQRERFGLNIVCTAAFIAGAVSPSLTSWTAA